MKPASNDDKLATDLAATLDRELAGEPWPTSAQERGVRPTPPSGKRDHPPATASVFAQPTRHEGIAKPLPQTGDAERYLAEAGRMLGKVRLRQAEAEAAYCRDRRALEDRYADECARLDLAHSREMERLRGLAQRLEAIRED